MRLNVILVGCGNMGFSMLSSWLRSGILQASQVLVVEPIEDLRLRTEALCIAGVSTEAHIPAAADPELIVFAVKPQAIGEVAASYRRFSDGKTTFLSLAAGVPLVTFEKILGLATPIIRCMPNMPVSIGKGMTVTTSNARVSEKSKEFVDRLMKASGEVEAISDERLMDAVTAVSGSGPAYVFYFIESLATAAEKLGLSPGFAMRLARQTVYGAACFAAGPHSDPAELRRQVTSPHGTTAAALAILMEDNRLNKLVAEATAAAMRRSVELTPPA